MVAARTARSVRHVATCGAEQAAVGPVPCSTVECISETTVLAAVSSALHSVEAHMPILAGVEMVATSMADICWPVGTVPLVIPFTFALIVSTMGVQMASTVGDKMI